MIAIVTDKGVHAIEAPSVSWAHLAINGTTVIAAVVDASETDQSNALMVLSDRFMTKRVDAPITSLGRAGLTAYVTGDSSILVYLVPYTSAFFTDAQMTLTSCDDKVRQKFLVNMDVKHLVEVARRFPDEIAPREPVAPSPVALTDIQLEAGRVTCNHHIADSTGKGYSAACMDGLEQASKLYRLTITATFPGLGGKGSLRTAQSGRAMLGRTTVVGDVECAVLALDNPGDSTTTVYTGTVTYTALPLDFPAVERSVVVKSQGDAIDIT